MIVVTRDALDPEAITATVRHPASGGVVTFLGITRNHSNGRTVLYLEYEAYEAMAERELAKIASETRERFGVREVSIAHRFGHLDIGEISLVVAVGSDHRREAFAACAYVVDRIKETVPIWKKEVFEDGEVWVGMDACEGHVHDPALAASDPEPARESSP